MMHLLSDDLRRDPYPLYDQLRAATPVVREPATGAWLLFDHASVRRALTEHDGFSSVVTLPSGPAPDWMIFADPPRHSRLRAIISRAFTPRSVAALEPRVRALSAELLDPLVGRGEIDLVTEYADLLPTMVIAEMIGLPAADRARHLGWSAAIMQLSYAIVGGDEAWTRLEAHAAARDEMLAYLRGCLDERRRAPRADLLTRLVEAELDGDRLSDEEILGFFQLLLLAGTETTTNVIDNAVLSLLEHPAELARLRADPALLPLAIEEVIRFRSPAQLAFRSTTRAVELGGQTIPAGAFVMPVIGAANRDPAAFAEPARFDVGRDPNPHVGFGHGIHFCIGAALARLEARVALGDLLERLPDLERADPGPWTPRPGLLVHGPSRLPVRFRAAARRP